MVKEELAAIKNIIGKLESITNPESRQRVFNYVERWNKENATAHQQAWDNGVKQANTITEELVR
jgi:hypothetical protein